MLVYAAILRGGSFLEGISREGFLRNEDAGLPFGRQYEYYRRAQTVVTVGVSRPPTSYWGMRNQKCGQWRAVTTTNRD